MKAGYKIINANLTCDNDDLVSVLVFNYHTLNEVISYYMSFLPTKYQKSNKENLVGAWNVKELKNKTK